MLEFGENERNTIENTTKRMNLFLMYYVGMFLYFRFILYIAFI